MFIKRTGHDFLFNKQVSCVNLFVIFYQREKNTKFSINSIDLNYEKPNKIFFS